MNLFLHWLRWDLRRFRWPLLAWTALLAGFVCYLGWLHLNLLTVDPRILKYNEACGAVLGIFEFFVLLLILTSDPAAGTRPFWKTRPPAGPAVAGAKLVIVFFFFLVLPMLSQWLMYQVCGLGGPGPHWSGKSWPWMLWWTQCLALAATLLASSVTRGVGHALGRLIGGAIALVAAVVAFQQWSPRSPDEMYRRIPYISALENALLHLGNASLWLAAGAAVFLLCRRTRSASPLLRAAPLFLPSVLLCIAVLSSTETPRWKEPLLPPLREEVAAAIKIGGPHLRGGARLDTASAGGSAVHLPGFSLSLKLSGLPAGCLANARWKTLRLIQPDGRILEASETNLEQQLGYRSADASTLQVSGIRFRPGELDAFSLTACRAEGVLNVTVHEPRSATVPLESGASMEAGDATLVIREILDLTSPGRGSGAVGSPQLGREMMHLSILKRDAEFPGAALRLQNRRQPACQVPLSGHGRSTSGYFMEHTREDRTIKPDSRISPVAAATLARDARTGQLSDWVLHAAWHTTTGRVEIPVVLEDVFIPRQMGDTRKAEDIVTAFDLSKLYREEIKRTIKLALVMPQIAMQESSDHEKDPLMLAIKALLDKVPREQLPLLLEIAKDDLPPGNMMARYAFDWPLCRGIAALMEQADVAELRREAPRLIRYLRHDLAERKLIPYNEAHGRGWEEYSTEELLSEWQKIKFGDSLHGAIPLLVALRQGYAWAIPELTELAELAPGDLSELVPLFSKLSDCPADPAAGIPWLQQNGARLTWDAAAKRWVLPAKP